MRRECHKCGNIWYISTPAECINVQGRESIFRCPKCGMTYKEGYKKDESKKVKE